MDQVYLVACETYDAERIQAGVKAAAQALGVALPERGEALLHATCPWAHPRYAPAAHTTPAVIEGVGRALAGTTLALGGNSVPDFPTRYSFRHAGYEALARRLGARLLPFDEAPTRSVTVTSPGVLSGSIVVPAATRDAFTVALPRLTGSTYLPFAGAMRHLHSLLPKAGQLEQHHRLPEKLIDLLPATTPNLIVVDAIQALHRGGELSGEPVNLGVLIIGTRPAAVDWVCAAAFGLEPDQVDVLKLASERGLGPSAFSDITLLGDVSLDDLRARAQQVQRVDPRPEHYPLPDHIKVIRSEKARQAGVSGSLTEMFLMLEQAGLSLKRARETTFVIGNVAEVPRGKSEYATIVFLDDTSRGEYAGYSRVVRLQGRNVPLSRLLLDVPFAMTLVNLRAELGGEFATAGFQASLARLSGGLLGRRG